MVSFTEYLHHHRVSEWQSEYVHYTLLRQQVREISRSSAGAKPDAGRSATASPGSEATSQDAPFNGVSVEHMVAVGTHDAALFVQHPRLRQQLHTRVQLGDDSESDDDDNHVHDGDKQPGDETHHCQHLDLDDKISKHQRKYHHDDQTDMQPSADECRHYDTERVHDYPPLSSLLPTTGVSALQQEQRFFDILDLDLHNVNAFYMSQQHYLDEHYELLSRQVTALQSSEQQHQSSHDKQYHELDRALRELYRGLLMIRTYRELNMTIVLKVLAQHDRVSSFNATATCLPYIQSMYAFKSPILDELIVETEQAYTTFVQTHDRRAAMQRLRAPDQHVSPFTYLLMGTSIGLTLCLVVIIAIEPGFIAGRRISLHGALLASIPVWKLFGVIILELYSYALLLYILKRYQINYNYIMGITQYEREQLKAPTILAIAATLSFLYTVALALYIFLLACVDSSDLDPATFNPNYVPLILFCVMLGLIFNPAPVYYWTARRQLLVQLFNVVIAPFGSISFATQSLGEQLTSYALPVLDLFRCFAFFFTGDFLTSSTTTWMTAINHDAIWIVAMLPFTWRALQCARLSYLNDGWYHKVNTAKYTSSMLNNIGRYLYQLRGTAYRPAYITFATIAFVFNTSWDIKMDWGLVEHKNAEGEKDYTDGWGAKKVVRSHDVSAADFLTEQMKQHSLAKYYKQSDKEAEQNADDGSSNQASQKTDSEKEQTHDVRLWRRYRFIRSRTLFSHSTYYISVAVDVLLRMNWYYLLGSNNYPRYINEAYLEAIVACGESVRRNIWNVMRLEREHLSNLNTLSAIEIQPPNIHVGATHGSCRHVQHRSSVPAVDKGVVVNWHV